MRVETRPTPPPVPPTHLPKGSVQRRRPRIRLSLRAWFRLFSAGLFAVVVIVLLIAFGAIPKRYNFLVIGSDQRTEEAGRSDVLIVVSLTKSPRDAISVVTIPRDTRVDIPGFGRQKVTHAYALGEPPQDGKKLGNAPLTKKTIEEFLDIPIHATVEVTFDSFQEIIDKLGGVDTTSKGHINGTRALKLVRNRNREGGDFARTADQREIFMNTVKEIREQNAWREIYDYLQSSSESRITMSTTHFSVFAVYATLRRGGNLSLEGLHTDVIPGYGTSIYTPEFGKALYYWIPDEEATHELVQKWLS